jgi:hypothetical protein
MALKDIRPRHVYLASAAAFVALAGFEGARMAAGHDPALAASARPQATPAPAAGEPPWRHRDRFDPYDPGAQGGVDPGAQSGLAAPDNGSQVPQPESRLS